MSARQVIDNFEAQNCPDFYIEPMSPIFFNSWGKHDNDIDILTKEEISLASSCSTAYTNLGGIVS